MVLSSVRTPEIAVCGGRTRFHIEQPRREGLLDARVYSRRAVQGGADHITGGPRGAHEEVVGADGGGAGQDVDGFWGS